MGSNPTPSAAIPPSESPKHSNWAAYAAAIWCFAFALPSFFWAAGGTTRADPIDDQDLTERTWFLVFTGLTGVLKLLGGLFALSLVSPWGERFPANARYWLALVAGAGMTLYGGVGLVLDAFRVSGVASVDDEETARWHLFLWDPIWLAGGILFILAALHFGSRTRQT
jgi:Protein of unknown function (DUF3995)